MVIYAHGKAVNGANECPCPPSTMPFCVIFDEDGEALSSSHATRGVITLTEHINIDIDATQMVGRTAWLKVISLH